MLQKGRSDEHRRTKPAWAAGTARASERPSTAAFGLHGLPLFGREPEMHRPDVCDLEELGRFGRSLARFSHHGKEAGETDEGRQAEPLHGRETGGIDWSRYPGQRPCHPCCVVAHAYTLTREWRKRLRLISFRISLRQGAFKIGARTALSART